MKDQFKDQVNGKNMSIVAHNPSSNAINRVINDIGIERKYGPFGCYR